MSRRRWMVRKLIHHFAYLYPNYFHSNGLAVTCGRAWTCGVRLGLSHAEPCQLARRRVRHYAYLALVGLQEGLPGLLRIGILQLVRLQRGLQLTFAFVLLPRGNEDHS
jgi:hypothetical protein